MTDFQHNLSIGVRGRFRGIAHTGHTYDEHGNIISFGEELRSTPFGRNKITNTGFNQLFTTNLMSIAMVAGTGSTAPAETQTTLTSYLGKTNTHVSTTTTRSTSPDGNGNVYWRVTVRMTFAPGSLGTGTKNLTELGIVLAATYSAISGTTAIAARGLLVDAGNNPAAITLDATNEYFDAIWEYTEYIPAEQTGTVSISVEGVATNYSFSARPCNFGNTGGSYNYKGWANVAAATLRGWALMRVQPTYDKADSDTQACAGPIGLLTGKPSGTYNAAYVPGGMTESTYVADSKQRICTLSFAPSVGNTPGGVGAVMVNLTHSQWQFGYTPALPKDAAKQMTLTFNITMANLP